MQNFYPVIHNDCLFELSGYETKAKVFATEKERENFLAHNLDWFEVNG